MKGKVRQRIFMVLLFGCMGLSHIQAMAQEKPPRPISVFTAQNMSFGAFFEGVSGGTVLLFPNGSRSATGDVVLVNMGFSYYPAIFEIEALPGTIISILFGPDVTLSGNNGGTMTLHIGGSDPDSPFISSASPPGRTQVRVGGTLTVGNPLANPPGAYNGTISVTFNQE